MKKVLYVATVDIHIKKFHIPYLKLLHDNGYEIHVATNGDEQISFCDEKHKICIERSPFKINNIKAIRQLKEIIEDEKFDIIHCHTPMGGVVARIAAKNARKTHGTRVIYTAHGFHFYDGAPLRNWIIYYPVEWLLSKITDTLITINKEDYKLAKKKFSKRCHDIQYVPGVGINTEKFKAKLSSEKQKELKQALKIKENDYLLTCIARLDINKNQGFLINIMERLTKSHNNIHLLLVGRDELNGYYQKMVESRNLDSNIHFLGNRDDISDLLSITDIVLSSSKREGLPVNVMEAFASGKPVVALNCRGMEDLIDNGKNGFIIYNLNYDEYVKKILEVISDKKLYNSIANNNLRKVDDYSIQKLTKTYYNIYINQGEAEYD